MSFNLSPNETNIFKIVSAIIQLINGRSNAVGEVTLRAGHTTTTVTSGTSPAAFNVAAGSAIFLTPKTATAAGVLASTYISSVAQQTFTITHPNDVDLDKTFGWECRG